MACLIKSKNKPLLDEYTSMLGSESAAYYVLCMNNGYSLEFTPSGERSDLFRLLLAKNSYDYEEAIREKAEMYYSSYYDLIGGDWTMLALPDVLDEKGEPKIEYSPRSIDFSDIFNQPISLDEMDQMNMCEILKNLIQEDLNDYLLKESPSSLPEQQLLKEKWLANKQKKLVNSINKDLISAFNLEKKVDDKGNVYFVSKDKDKNGRYKVVIQFCEYLENGKKGVYDQTGRIEAAVNLILISLTDADPTTINHELAHHYVRMFWDSEVIQKAAKKLDDGDRTEGWKVRLEEKLVDEITKRTTETEDFWSGLKEMLRSAFLWLSSPIKQNLLRKVSLAFRLNDQARAIKKESYLLEFIDPTVKRVYQSGAPNQFIDEFDTIASTDLNRAITKYVQDTVEFFNSYTAAPNSILKDEFDEYTLHVKNTLSSTTLSEPDFNIIYIYILDESNHMKAQYSDPDSAGFKAAVSLYMVINDVRSTRATFNPSTGTGIAPTGSSTTSSATLADLIKDLLRGLRTRVYEYQHSVPKAAQNANAVQELISRMEALSENADQLMLFINEGVEELSKINRQLFEMQRNGFADLTPQQLQSLWNTIEGFYHPALDIIGANDDVNIMVGGVLYQIGVKLSTMQSMCWSIKRSLTQANKSQVLQITHNYLVGDGQTDNGVVGDLLTDELKERFLDNFDDLLIFGKLFEDINMLLPYMGLASRSRSTVIRVARNMILSANAEIRHATLKDTAKIIKLYFAALPEMRKLGLKEILSVFQEMDENGTPTGYFVRKLNYGKFYRDMNNHRDEQIKIANEALKQALGANAPQITYDVHNNPVLPPDDDPTVKSILTKYSDELDDWLCKNANRMFTADYYKMRRTMLSPETRMVMLEMLSRINAIMSKAPIVKITLPNGDTADILATWELSPQDLLNLVQLRMEYQQLGNYYYSDGTKKTGDELKIAEEISKFNQWKSKLVSFKQNEDRFNACIEKIRAVHGRNSIEESRFRKLNTSIVVNPEYYEYVLSKIDLSNNPVLDELRKKRSDLKKLIDEFDKKGIDVEQKRRLILYWESLKEIDAQIQELLDGMSSGPVPEEKRWSHYFDKEMVMYDDNETLLDHMLKQDILEYRRTHPADTRTDDELREELVKKYLYTYTWYDNSGNPHVGVGLVSVFVRQVPKGASINENRLNGTFAHDALIVKYSNLFSDIDPKSSLYNHEFDRNDSHLVQPKGDIYNNSQQWDLINNNENIKNLYDALIDLMNRNNAKLPTNADFNYRLPQITGRRLTALRRSGSIKELCDAVKYNFQTDWKLNERDDDDINYEDLDLKIRANGTRINTVPTRYIKPLEHPEYITSDVIGSVIAFTEMANNFVVKTQLSSELEAVKHQLLDRQDPGIANLHNRQSTKNIIKLLTNMMDDLLYSNTTKHGDKTSNFSRKEELLIKFMTKFLHFGRILMLGYNFTSMNVGFWESYIRGNLEAVLGKDYNLRDLMHAYRNALKYSVPMLLQAGSIKASNKHVALMLWFGVSKRLKESYHSTERNRFIKLLSENINGMFGFTLGDYANSSFLLSMALSNVRFIEHPDIPVGFYTKLTLVKAIMKKNSNYNYKQAKALAMQLYKESGVCLEDAYDFKDGIVSVKQEYAPYVTKVIENRVTGKCYQRLAEALGVVPTDDNPGYSLQIMLRPLGTLRNYLFTVIARNWNWAHDLLKRYLDLNGKIVKEDDMLDGYLDIDAGNMNIGLHQGLYGWMKMVGQQLHIINKKANSPDFTDETKELYNYAAAKVGLEMLSIVMLVGLSTLFKALAKGADDDDWWYRFGYLSSVRLVNSFISVLDPTAFLEVIKNISTLISPLNDLINTITILSDMIGLSGHSPFDEILSGSYKGRTRLFRNLMRITPLGNAYEDLNSSALKSRANWYIQQDPLTWGSVGGAFDQLWGTGN